MKILVSAESFGYGPIATCLSVIKELKKHDDVIVDFIGSGISLEQAKLSNLFNNYYLCDTYDFDSLKKCEDIFKQYDIFFSSENVNGAIYGLNYIKNVYYVDNLVWMWDKIPKELGKVKKFFISETFPCIDNYNRIGNVINNPVFVGPVRCLYDDKKKQKKSQLLINIGGASSFLLEQTVINDFYNKIINNILATPNINQFDSIIICGGSKTINSLKIEKKCNKVIIQTIAHDDLLNVINESSHCIMSSGLGNFIETLNKDINIMYLPPVNYSQLLQLQYYEKMKFGFHILNWSLFDFYKDIPMYLDEETGVNMVVDNIKHFNDGVYDDIITKSVSDFLNYPQQQFFNIRNTFYKMYDKNASSVIAETIYNDSKKELFDENT